MYFTHEPENRTPMLVGATSWVESPLLGKFEETVLLPKFSIPRLPLRTPASELALLRALLRAEQSRTGAVVDVQVHLRGLVPVWPQLHG